MANARKTRLRKVTLPCGEREVPQDKTTWRGTNEIGDALGLVRVRDFDDFVAACKRWLKATLDEVAKCPDPKQFDHIKVAAHAWFNHLLSSEKDKNGRVRAYVLNEAQLWAAHREILHERDPDHKLPQPRLPGKWMTWTVDMLHERDWERYLPKGWADRDSTGKLLKEQEGFGPD